MLTISIIRVEHNFPHLHILQKTQNHGTKPYSDFSTTIWNFMTQIQLLAMPKKVTT